MKLLSKPSCKQGWGKKRESKRACTTHGKSTKGDGSKEAELRRRGVGREAGWKGAEHEIQILEAEGRALAV